MEIKKYANEFSKILSLKNKGEYELDLTYFNFFNFDAPGHYSKKFISLFGKKLQSDGKNLKKHHFNFAASAQKRFEEAYINAFKHHVIQNKSKNICLGGGAAMNCLANAVLSEKFPKVKIHVPFAPDDLGLSTGSALFASRYIYNEKVSSRSIPVYSGRSFDNTEIKAKLTNYKIKYSFYHNIEKKVAELISENNVVGWFQGRSEFGQRALGNRSILGDPRNPKMKDIINQKIKYREKFRPFAPSILIEDVNKFFNISKNIIPNHMQFAVKAKKYAIKKAPAIVHNDLTARIQIVSKNENKKYYNLINCFKRITKIPIILNTSFNLKGEPIVDTPEDALRTFNTSGIDYLCMGNYLISKE